MTRWMSPSEITRVDWASKPNEARVEDGRWGGGIRVEISRETIHGRMILRKVPCVTVEQAQAVLAATTLEGTF